jgi:hypothetical protein
MNWEEVVQIISDSVKEQEVRRSIYRRLLESLADDERDLKQALDIDTVFDEEASEYIDEEEDLFEDEDYDYDQED